MTLKLTDRFLTHRDGTRGRQIKALLDKAETSPTWNLTLLTIREARRYVEELMMLNLTVPSSRAAAPDASAKQKDY